MVGESREKKKCSLQSLQLFFVTLSPFPTQEVLVAEQREKQLYC